MVIEDIDFRLTPINDCSSRFDLELLHIVKPRGKEARKEFRVEAYGVSIDRAIEMIAHYRVCNGHKDEAITLKEYCSEFIKNKDSIVALCRS